MRTFLLFLLIGIGSVLSAQTFVEMKAKDTIVGVAYSSVAFGDIDCDQDMDLLLSGVTSDNKVITKLYRNNGSGIFTELLDSPLINVFSGSVAFADIDGDNDPDFLSLA